jgi:hypothetical protein
MKEMRLLGSDKGKYAHFYCCSTRKEIVSRAQINVDNLHYTSVSSSLQQIDSLRSLVNVLSDPNYVQIFNTIRWLLWSKNGLNLSRFSTVHWICLLEV